MITEHTICALPEGDINYQHYAITASYRGDGRWAVRSGPFCFGADGEWDYEPSPSSRTDEWLDTHRFDEQAALRLAEEQAPLMTCNGISVAEALARGTR
ncbi:hypothetical protein [Paractinoplanes maris]|uniref:hypothetical protein n=1 Tax=Paractinoplanes maris TaxID=1734446 RepID=UPI00201FCF5C|nr:hypothetical protein [Actinoplanes maris]